MSELTSMSRSDPSDTGSVPDGVSRQASPEDYLRPPPAATRVPSFDAGWLTEEGERCAFLSYVSGSEMAVVNWSEDLEELHERASAHFMDAWTRRVVLAHLGPLPPSPRLIDIGCSTGYLLDDLRRCVPHATLIGLDPIASGLAKAHVAVPQAQLLQAEVDGMPLRDASVDVVLSANVLEHVSDDEQALAEIFRILRPGGRAVIVIPLDPSSYNYFDRVLGHERRYARGELARKGEHAGLHVREEVCLGGLLYPAFWVFKRYSQKRYGHLQEEALEHKVAKEVEETSHSLVGRAACRLEEVLQRRGLRFPFGIRGLTVFERPGS